MLKKQYGKIVRSRPVRSRPLLNSIKKKQMKIFPWEQTRMKAT